MPTTDSKASIQNKQEGEPENIRLELNEHTNCNIHPFILPQVALHPISCFTNVQKRGDALASPKRRAIRVGSSPREDSPLDMPSERSITV